MNIDLTPNLDFSEYNTQTFLVCGTIVAVALILTVVSVVYAKRFYDKTIAAQDAHKAMEESAKHPDEKTLEAINKLGDQGDKLGNRTFGFSLSATLLLVVALVTAITGVTNVATNADEQTARQVTMNIRDAVNETYDVEISFAEANQLKSPYLYHPFGTNSGSHVSAEDVDTKSDSYVTTESYGTTTALTHDEKIVSVQLVRVKQEFRLVYTRENSSNVVELKEVEKREAN